MNTSTEIIKNPDVVHSKKYLDFGRGFYITTFENQAKKWAVRKGMRQKKTAIVNVYELSEEWSGFRVLSFEKENEKWLDFVCACRKGQSLNKEYDIIIGNVADGYEKACEFNFSDQGNAVFYKKEEASEVHILSVIETETLKDEHTKQLNDFFGEFWRDNIGKEEEKQPIYFTFVIFLFKR